MARQLPPPPRNKPKTPEEALAALKQARRKAAIIRYLHRKNPGHSGYAKRLKQWDNRCTKMEEACTALGVTDFIRVKTHPRLLRSNTYSKPVEVLDEAKLQQWFADHGLNERGFPIEPVSDRSNQTPEQQALRRQAFQAMAQAQQLH